MLIVVLLGMVIVSIPLARAYGEIDEAFVHEWADAHGLTLTTATRPMVWWYLLQARVLRTVGVLAGIVLPPLFVAALGFSGQGVTTVFWCIFAGHLAGALYAEVALRRPLPSGTRVAALEPREVHQYLPNRLRFAPAGVTCVAAALAALGLVTGDVDAATQRTVGATLAASVAVAALIGVAQRWVLHRPQPFTEAEFIEADDAIRSQSVHMLAGSGSAVLLALNGAMLAQVSMDTAAPISTIVGVPAFAMVPLAIVSCLYYGHRAWKVKRSPRTVRLGAAQGTLA